VVGAKGAPVARGTVGSCGQVTLASIQPERNAGRRHPTAACPDIAHHRGPSSFRSSALIADAIKARCGCNQGRDGRHKDWCLKWLLGPVNHRASWRPRCPMWTSGCCIFRWRVQGPRVLLGRDSPEEDWWRRGLSRGFAGRSAPIGVRMVRTRGRGWAAICLNAARVGGHGRRRRRRTVEGFQLMHDDGLLVARARWRARDVGDCGRALRPGTRRRVGKCLAQLPEPQEGCANLVDGGRVGTPPRGGGGGAGLAAGARCWPG